MSDSVAEPLITADGTLRVKWAVAIAVITIAGALITAHNSLEKRISSLEHHSQRQGADIQEIKLDTKETSKDVKTLLYRTNGKE